LEDPIQLDMTMNELTVMLRNYQEDDALRTAMRLAPQYVCDYKNLIKFTRANEWNIQKTVTMMVLHFQYKLELFGPAKLGQDICWDDLDPQTQQCVLSGTYQISFDSVDRAGRPFSFLNMATSHGKHYTREQILISMVS
jgi:hypothetical protein